MSGRVRLEQLLSDTRPDNNLTGLPAFIPTGFPELDETLCGGWPAGALVELLPDCHGVGELGLLLPAIATLIGPRETADSHQQKWVLMIAPPYVPFVPALERHGLDTRRLLMATPRRELDGLWAMEQALRSGVCTAVLAWSSSATRPALRRLQLAAAGSRMAVLFRPPAARRDRSPAALRLRLQPTGEGRLRLEIFRNRNGRPGSVSLDVTG